MEEARSVGSSNVRSGLGRTTKSQTKFNGAMIINKTKTLTGNNKVHHLCVLIIEFNLNFIVYNNNMDASMSFKFTVLQKWLSVAVNFL